MDKATLEAQIDTNITNQTAAGAIPPTLLGTQLKNMVDYIGTSLVATFSQVGTSIPTLPVIVNNTFGITPVLSRASTGSYLLTMTGAFTTNKTIVMTCEQAVNIADRSLYMSTLSVDSIQIISRKISDGTFADFGQSNAAVLEIRVYQ